MGLLVQYSILLYYFSALSLCRPLRPVLFLTPPASPAPLLGSAIPSPSTKSNCNINIKGEKNTEQRKSLCHSTVKQRSPCGMDHFWGTLKQRCNAISGKQFHEVAISSLDFAKRRTAIAVRSLTDYRANTNTQKRSNHKEWNNNIKN